jgi:hypothetical protein
MGFNRIYPLVNFHITNWKIHPFYSWENPRTNWPFSIAMFVDQRVSDIVEIWGYS